MGGDYQKALEAAGAKVHEFKEFGSYQGHWFALVTYKGERGWVSGSYGSCGGCDSFEAEFGYSSDYDCDKHAYASDEKKVGCAECATLTAAYNEKLKSFGEGYLGGVAPADNILKELDEAGEWDDDSKEAAAWIRAEDLV